MAESSNSGAWTAIGIVGGLIAGSLFTYIVFKSREPQPPQTPALQTSFQTSTMHPIDVDTLRQMSAEIQNLSKLVAQLSQENSALNIQLAATREVKPQVEAPKITPITTTAYKNNEKWQIERGKDGFIKSFNVIRDAKTNAAG